MNTTKEVCTFHFLEKRRDAYNILKFYQIPFLHTADTMDTSQYSSMSIQSIQLGLCFYLLSFCKSWLIIDFFGLKSGFFNFYIFNHQLHMTIKYTSPWNPIDSSKVRNAESLFEAVNDLQELFAVERHEKKQFFLLGILPQLHGEYN